MPSTPARSMTCTRIPYRLNGPYHGLRRIAFVNNWRLAGTALQLAIELHDGQTRKAGGPFVYHPIRVALKLWTLGICDEYILAAALLHDVLEDCVDKLTKGILLRFHSQNAETVAIVHLLTKQKESHDDRVYFDRIATRWEATLIKLADRADNLATMMGASSREGAREYVEETKRYITPLARTRLTGNGQRCSAFKALEWEIQFLTRKAEQDFNLGIGNAKPANCHTQ